MENWLFPNVPLIRVGADKVTAQEHDYVQRMRMLGIDAVGSIAVSTSGATSFSSSAGGRDPSQSEPSVSTTGPNSP